MFLEKWQIFIGLKYLKHFRIKLLQVPLLLSSFPGAARKAVQCTQNSCLKGLRTSRADRTWGSTISETKETQDCEHQLHAASPLRHLLFQWWEKRVWAERGGKMNWNLVPAKSSNFCFQSDVVKAEQQLNIDLINTVRLKTPKGCGSKQD